MATVAAAGGERMLLRRPHEPLLHLRPHRLKPAAGSKPRTSPSVSSTSRIGSPPSPSPAALRRPLRLALLHRAILGTSPSVSSTSRIGSPPPPPPRPVGSVIKGKDKSTRELQSSSCHLKKTNKISKPKVKTGDVLPGASSPPSYKTRKVRREVLPHMEPLDQSSGDLLPSQGFLEEQRAYFVKIDAFE